MDFVDTFRRWVGRTEAPPEYIRWAALSLLAAACGNRVFLPYRIGNREMKKLANLYCMLLGPSGNFKSFTMNCIEEVLAHTEVAERLRLYRGHITHSGLYDEMRTKKRKKNRKTGEYDTVDLPFAGQFYLLQDEIASDIGSVEMADAFIRAVTKMYHGGVFDDTTRANGHVHLENYSINWLSGSTLDWLVLSVSPATLNGGFFGRTVMVHCDYTDTRIYPGDVKVPDNVEHMFNYLTARVDSVLAMHGAIPLTPEAIEVDRAWYMQQEPPAPGVSDPTMQSSRRQHDLSLKLGLLLAISAERLEVDGETLARAQEMTRQVVAWQRQVLPSIQRGTHGTPQEALLEAVIGASAGITHARLYEGAYRRFSMRAHAVDELVRTWINAGLVAEEKRHGITYYIGAENVKKRDEEAAHNRRADREVSVASKPRPAYRS